MRLVQSKRSGEVGGRPALTSRETEVVQLMVDGRSTVGIAQQLGVSVNTVRNHTQAVLRKLRAHSRLEAAATAVRLGIATPPRPSSRP
jgi:DNA-binding NarL/FixJ family response regulator